MKAVNYFILIITFSVFTSCFQEDEPVSPYVSPPGVKTNVASIGPLYDKQLFYDLETDSFVKIVDRNAWDLALESTSSGYHIFINSSKLMKVAKTGNSDFSITYSTVGLDWKYDNSGGWSDSTAFGEWGIETSGNVTSYEEVYIIDRGLSPTGNNIGYKKIKILGLNNNNYQIQFANLDGSSSQMITIPKSDNHHFVYLSFDNGVVDIEPPKSSWDLLFTQYTALVKQQSTGIIENYSVNGTLLNPHQVVASREFSKSFEDILFSDLANYQYTKKRDIIGYDWKDYDFDLSVYIIFPNRNYIVKSVEGNYFKIRFTSFTNDLGERGYPTFEVSKF